VITVVQDYDKIYKVGKYKDLWFSWDGKPPLLYNSNPSVDANGVACQTQPALQRRPRPTRSIRIMVIPTTPRSFTKLHQRGEELHIARNVVGYWEWPPNAVGTEDN
jgi:hypothetical protein